MAQNIFKKIKDDKRAINDCIKKHGDLKILQRERGIKFATPISIASILLGIIQ